MRGCSDKIHFFAYKENFDPYFLKLCSVYRGGHHRYSIDAEGTSATSKDLTTSASSLLRHHSG